MGEAKSRPSVAVIGGETLLGREIRELLEATRLPIVVNLVATTVDQSGILTAQHGEPAIMTPLNSADAASSVIVFLAGAPDANAEAWRVLSKDNAQATFIDLSGGLEDNPNVRLRAPLIEEDDRASGAQIQVIAQPAAIALALFLTRLHKAAPIRRSVIQIFEPASERGQRGLDELQQQTVGLLSFQKLKKETYDAQAGFNMLPRFGDDAPRALGDIELKIERHLASLLAMTGTAPMPSLRLSQAPVFHGYTLSAWVEFENDAEPQRTAEALASAQVEIRANDEEPPTNVGVAGQSGITVGAIERDRNDPRACWYWIVTDNLRIAAENAVEAAREILQ